MPTSTQDLDCKQINQLIRELQAIPPPPAHVEAIADPGHRDRAIDVWNDACRLKNAVTKWMKWWEELRNHGARKPGDPDPNLAARCKSMVLESLHTFYFHRANIEMVKDCPLETVEKMLPDVPPTGSTKDKSFQRKWRKEFRHHQSYYGKRKGRWEDSGASILISLEGQANVVLECLKKRPSKAFSTPPPDGEAPSEVKWSKPDSPSRWARKYGVSQKTFKRMLEDGTIPYKKLTSKSYMIAEKDTPSESSAATKTPAK